MRYLAAAIFLFIGSSPVSAQLFTVKGTCASLKIGEQDLTAQCEDEAANVAPNAKSISFFFPLKNGGFVEFLGSDGANPSDSSDLTNLREVVMKKLPGSLRDETKEVTGMCLYGNPNKPDARIVCSARAADGEVFSAEFEVVQGSAESIMPPGDTPATADPGTSAGGPTSQGYDVTEEEIAADEADYPQEFLPTKTVNVCNQSRRTINIATYQKYNARTDDTNYIVVGWWEIKKGECREMNYPEGDFAFYAMDGKGREWSGKRRLCIDFSAFQRIYQEQYRCEKRLVRGFKNYRSDEQYATITLN